MPPDEVLVGSLESFIPLILFCDDDDGRYRCSCRYYRCKAMGNGNGQDPRSRSTDFCGAAAMPFFEDSSEIS